MKAIRGLCKQLGAPAAPPHVFAGVSSILTTSPPYQQSMTENDLERLRSLSVESLIVAVYMLVRTRLSGVETDPSTVSEQRDTALTVLIQVRNGEETSTAIDPTSVMDWMQEIRRGRWTELDWFSNVTVGAGLGLDDPEATHPIDSDRGDSDDDEPVAHGKRAAREYGAEKPYLQPGLNTMVCRWYSYGAKADLCQMQARVDYLSDEKRAEYQIWKKGILARIDRMEKAERAKEQAA